jgi:hypothetical protein
MLAPRPPTTTTNARSATAGREDLRSAFCQPGGLALLAIDDDGLLRPEIDPVDRGARLVQDVRDAIGAEDHRLDVERRLAAGE